MIIYYLFVKENNALCFTDDVLIIIYTRCDSKINQVQNEYTLKTEEFINR